MVAIAPGRKSETMVRRLAMPSMTLAAAMGGLLVLAPWPLSAAGGPGGPPADLPSRPAASMRMDVRGGAREAVYIGGFDATSAPIQREIVDPCLGTRWQLVPDALHPERPGRLILVDSEGFRVPSPAPLSPGLSGLSPFRSGPSSLGPPPAIPSGRDPVASSASAPAIRAGDRITVLQKTATLDARLAAVALEPAVVGQRLRVRLQGGAGDRAENLGAVVDVRAASAATAIWLNVDQRAR